MGLWGRLGRTFLLSYPYTSLLYKLTHKFDRFRICTFPQDIQRCRYYCRHIEKGLMDREWWCKTLRLGRQEYSEGRPLNINQNLKWCFQSSIWGWDSEDKLIHIFWKLNLRKNQMGMLTHTFLSLILRNVDWDSLRHKSLCCCTGSRKDS